jgi:periplasmic protein CpxP/Spy
MNIKHVLLLPSLFAIALSSVAVLPVVAQNQPNAEMQQLRKMGKGMANLNLSDAQKAQMKQIKDESKAAIANLLNPDQKAQWETLKQSGQRGGWKKGEGAMKALNLSETQKAQIKQIRETAKQKMEAILTADQKAQMQQNRQNFRMRRQAQ